MTNGWIKIHRKTLDNPVVMKDAAHAAVWLYLLLSASHDEHRTVFNGKVITLQAGQLVTGRKKIADALSLDESKVRRILNSFENDRMIDQQMTNGGRLISLLNWECYQKSDQQTDQQVTNERPTSDQRVTTIQEYKELKNDKNVRKNIGRFTPPTPDEVRDYCQERGNSVDAQRFVDYYASKGWMIGKNKMKDWRAAVRTWERNTRNEDNDDTGEYADIYAKYRI